MKVILVVGARPNFMKVAPILRAIADANQHKSGALTPVLVHTGQHYDAAMSDAFFADLNLPRPDIHLGVGSGSHGTQTAEIMRKFEGVLESERPDAVLVVGDVNSTVACALVTAKISFDAVGSRPLLGHVEAGLRSFDRTMPEECNRVVTDHLSDLLFVTEESGLRNLSNEGIPQDRVFFVGNTMIDSLLECEKEADNSTILQRLGLMTLTWNGSVHKKPYVLLTLHRPANVDNRDAFLEILEGLHEAAVAQTVIFPAHPRTKNKIQQHQLESYFVFQSNDAQNVRNGSAAAINMIDPLGYLDFLCLMRHAALVVTDSGGIQEETTCLGVPCVTVRENTERPITLTAGTNILGGTRRDSIRAAIRGQLQRTHHRSFPERWDGKAGQRIVEVLLRQLQLRSSMHCCELTPAAHALP
ncbi:MAG: UDP-N-acetylglucosamine 2-epimerase (non-hydrolyzing) [Acidobacteriia bacterium]|nr:UDP-N-acetylglucosamine 2-epimerase (non-hydrolyzing) [Terriglobia bacterium]